MVYALLAAHVLWIANHMRLVYLDRINPWRLGGYAMYTVAKPRLKIRFLDQSVPGSPMVMPGDGISFKAMNAATQFTNVGRTFRCAHIPPRALRAFFVENARLAGLDMSIVLFDTKFLRKAPWFEGRQQGEVAIHWQDAKSFQYKSVFCENEETGTVDLP